MVEELKVLGSIVDFPVTVMGFMWALRMIERMNKEVVCLLQDCLTEKLEDT